MAETVDIIRTVVDGINKSFTAKSIVDNGDGTYTLLTCDTLYLQENFNLTIDSVVYKILTIVKDTSVLLSGSVIPGLSTFDIYAPFYFHGTVIKTKNEIQVAQEIGASSQLAIMPFIYLKEILSDKVYPKGSASPYEKETTLQIMHLTFSNFTDWSTTDHYEKSIYQMTKLVELFVESIEKSSLIGPFEEPYDSSPRVNFGVNTDNGNTKSLFVDHLSGVLQTITLKFYKDACITCS